jgi:hypothetical protein
MMFSRHRGDGAIRQILVAGTDIRCNVDEERESLLHFSRDARTRVTILVSSSH